jgi:hypothetical protein
MISLPFMPAQKQHPRLSLSTTINLAMWFTVPVQGSYNM